jgi:hypothetical protein
MVAANAVLNTNRIVNFAKLSRLKIESTLEFQFVGYRLETVLVNKIFLGCLFFIANLTETYKIFKDRPEIYRTRNLTLRN